jgi:hypothetical protein
MKECKHGKGPVIFMQVLFKSASSVQHPVIAGA